MSVQGPVKHPKLGAWTLEHRVGCLSSSNLVKIVQVRQKVEGQLTLLPPSGKWGGHAPPPLFARLCNNRSQMIPSRVRSFITEHGVLLVTKYYEGCHIREQRAQIDADVVYVSSKYFQ